MPSGPRRGIYGMLTAMVIWSAVVAATFLFARAVRAEDFRTFFQALLGRFWVMYKIERCARLSLKRRGRPGSPRRTSTPGCGFLLYALGGGAGSVAAVVVNGEVVVYKRERLAQDMVKGSLGGAGVQPHRLRRHLMSPA